MLNYRTDENKYINVLVPRLPMKKSVPERSVYHA